MRIIQITPTEATIVRRPGYYNEHEEFVEDGEEFYDPEQKLFDYSQPYRYQLIDGGRQIACWDSDIEHDYRRLMFVDATTGIVERILWDLGPEYGAEIKLRQDGKRIIHTDVLSHRWACRDRKGKSWQESQVVETRFLSDEERSDADHFDCTHLVASADGTIVAMAGSLSNASCRRLRIPRDQIEQQCGRIQIWKLNHRGQADDISASWLDTALPQIDVLALTNEDQSLFAMASYELLIPLTVWNWKTGQRMAEIPIHKKRKEPTTAVFLTFSPNGQWLLVDIDQTLQLYDTIQWKKAWEFKSKTAGIIDLDFRSDSQLLAIGQTNGTIQFCDLNHFSITTSFDFQVKPKSGDIVIPGLPALVGVSFSAEGLTCAAGYSDGQVVLWDVE